MEFNTLWSNKKDIFQSNLERGSTPVYQSHYDNLSYIDFNDIWKKHKTLFENVLNKGIEGIIKPVT